MRASQMIVTALDCPDPMILAGRLRPLRRFAFLDSALAGGAIGRHAFLAAAPFGTLRVTGGRTSWSAEHILA